MRYQTFHRAIIGHLLASGYWKVLPEVSWNGWFADYIAWGTKPGVLEVEVKQSWSDYLNDRIKSCSDRVRMFDQFWNEHRQPGDWYPPKLRKAIRQIPARRKYECLWSGPARWRPTHFLYAAPMELACRIAADPERPRQFGVWGFRFVPEVKHETYTARAYWQFEKSHAPARRIRTMTPDEFSQFNRQAGDRACTVLRDLYMQEVSDESYSTAAADMEAR
jgi:hypothetical protein